MASAAACRRVSRLVSRPPCTAAHEAAPASRPAPAELSNSDGTDADTTKGLSEQRARLRRPASIGGEPGRRRGAPARTLLQEYLDRVD